MSLARVKTWNPGDVLTAADLNGEFNNVLNNPISLVSPTTGAINFNLQAHTNLTPSAISASSGVAGQTLQVVGGVSAWAAAPAAFFPSRVTGLVGLVSSQTGTFSAESYIQRTTGGTASWTISATSSFSASVGTAGPTAGGRDVAAAFASTYVHWYAISTGSGSTAPAGLVSTNPPTVGPAALPTGYSGWTYLGASVYSSASTSVTSTHRMRGNKAFYLLGSTNTLLSAGSVATSLAPVSISSAIPPNAPAFFISVVNNAAVPGALSVDTASTYFLIPGVISIMGHVIIPQTSDGLTYQMSGGASLTLNANGYVMPNGDV